MADRLIDGSQNSSLSHKQPKMAHEILNSKPLKILNWNARSILGKKRVKFLELQHLLSVNSVDVACITETHLKPNTKTYSEDFVIYRRDRPAGNDGGVAIFVRKSLRHQAIRVNSTSCEVVGVEVTLSTGPLQIVTAYCSKTKVNFSDLLPIFATNKPTIIAGDFNAKHTAWGCRVTSTKGRSLMRLALAHQLNIDAPSEHTHHPADITKKSDILDIFITQNIRLEKDPWSTHELSSDHHPVFLEVPATPSLSPVTRSTIDWLHLRYNLEKSHLECTTISKQEDIDLAVEALKTDINEAIQNATSTHPVPRRSRNLPEDILQLIKRKNRTRRRYQRRKDPTIRAELNALQRELAARLGAVTDDSVDDYIAEAESHPNSAWKVVRSLRNRQPHLPALKHDGQSFSIDADKAEIFAESIEKQCSPLPSEPKHAKFHQEVEIGVDNFSPTDKNFPPTTPGEIKEILKNLSKKKAPGNDGISNGVLKILPITYIMIICNIINGMMRLNYFPAAWKEATVICLPKAGKPLSSPSSYRPISLLNALSKVAEAVILRRLEKVVEDKNLIPDHQHGFRKKHGSGHQLLRVAEHLAEKMNKRQHSTMVLLDVKEAFDRVWREGLIHKLIEMGIPDYLIAIIKSFLTDRYFRVRVGASRSTRRRTSAGVPQGSKLSPLLFNLFCANMPTASPIITALYADDIALLDSTPQAGYSSNRINKFLPKLLGWYHKWRLSINESKSVAVFFSRKKDPPPKIKVNSIPIEWSHSAKYLGVIFDKKLTWIPQITATRNKILAACVALKPFFSNKRVSRGTKLRTFNAIIRSIASYGIPIWGSTEPCRLNRLQGTYMKILRTALNIPWFIRNEQILSETGVPSIQQLAAQHAVNLRASVIDHPNPSISSLTTFAPKNFDIFWRPCHLVQ